MEKCWFVLRQNQYPPPTLPVNGIGSGNGPISLGHIIPNTIDLDGVINRTVKGFNFTPLVPVVSTHAWDLEWEMGGDRQVGFSADPRAPVAQAVGLTVQANAVLAFQQTVQRYRTFHSLNCYIIQPTRDFVAESLEEPQVADYIQRTKFLGSWTVYMTTGVTIARGSSGGTSELRQRSIGAGATLDLAGAAGLGVNTSTTSQEGMSLSAGAESDFVWAVRLTKIWEGKTDKSWSFRTQSKGATFSLGDENQRKEETAQALLAEGAEEREKLWLGEDEGYIVY